MHCLFLSLLLIVLVWNAISIGERVDRDGDMSHGKKHRKGKQRKRTRLQPPRPKSDTALEMIPDLYDDYFGKFIQVRCHLSVISTVLCWSLML